MPTDNPSSGPSKGPTRGEEIADAWDADQHCGESLAVRIDSALKAQWLRLVTIGAETIQELEQKFASQEARHQQEMEPLLYASDKQAVAWKARAEKAEQELAEAKREADAEIDSALKLGDLLRRTCDALKGQHPDPLTRHSWHDLPEVAISISEHLKATTIRCGDLAASYEEAESRLREAEAREKVLRGALGGLRRVVCDTGNWHEHGSDNVRSDWCVTGPEEAVLDAAIDAADRALMALSSGPQEQTDAEPETPKPEDGGCSCGNGSARGMLHFRISTGEPCRPLDLSGVTVWVRPPSRPGGSRE